MDDFKLIYHILRFPKCAANQEEFDDDAFTAEYFKISQSKWGNTLEMLVDRGYIKGVEIRRGGQGDIRLSISTPRITLAGLEYLCGNEYMLKSALEAKGIQ